jgi:transcriptional regulator with XRE-family HTH domain
VAYPKALETIGDHIRKRRLDLKLLQKDVAGMLKVDTNTITNWERNRCQPKLYLIARIVGFIGYEPVHSGSLTLGESLRQYRRLKGIGQKELARKLGIDPSTLAKYEAGKNKRRTALEARLKSLMIGVARRRLDSLDFDEIP